MSEPIGPADDMPCQELVEVATEWLEGVLGPDERRRVEAHLALCDGCDDYVAQLRATIVALGDLRDAPPSAATRDAVLRRLGEWEGGPA